MSESTSETIVVLAGGLSHEREVSLRSGRRVAQALRDRGCLVVEADVNAALVPVLQGIENPVVFPLLHGGVGEDGSLREVLDLLEVPYVGSDAASSRLAFDKSICTPVVSAAGILTPLQLALPADIFRDLGAKALMGAVAERLGFPLMVKPARGGSALGCTKVNRPSDLPSAMVSAYAYGDAAIIEEFIEGTEVALTVVDLGDGPVVLPAVEIRPRSGVYDFSARYTAGETRFLVPASLPDEVAQRCADVALEVHRVIELGDLSRTDLIVAADGQPIFLETNVAPGMTETSLVPLAIEAAGWEFGEVCERLARNAARRYHAARKSPAGTPESY